MYIFFLENSSSSWFPSVDLLSDLALSHSTAEICWDIRLKAKTMLVLTLCSWFVIRTDIISSECGLVRLIDSKHKNREFYHKSMQADARLLIDIMISLIMIVTLSDLSVLSLGGKGECNNQSLKYSWQHTYSPECKFVHTKNLNSCRKRYFTHFL